MNRHLIITDLVSKELFRVISERLDKSQDVFVIGLSGGSLAQTFINGAVETTSVDWSRIKFIFCDERMVPIDDEDSTYKIYKEGLIGVVNGISEANFILANTDLTTEEAARDYETKIKEYAVRGFDLLLLGMGPDGHICSLFPGHPLLEEKNAIVSPITDSPKPPPRRITLTFPYINKSKCVIFVCTGEGKRVMVKNVIKSNMEEFPASRVNLENGDLYWLLDRPAASYL